jgi:hypothetical protein
MEALNFVADVRADACDVWTGTQSQSLDRNAAAQAAGLPAATLAELLDHVAADTLVIGCWNPGEGRTMPPLAHNEFVQKFRRWFEKGAAAPERGEADQ